MPQSTTGNRSPTAEQGEIALQLEKTKEAVTSFMLYLEQIPFEIAKYQNNTTPDIVLSSEIEGKEQFEHAQEGCRCWGQAITGVYPEWEKSDIGSKRFDGWKCLIELLREKYTCPHGKDFAGQELVKRWKTLETAAAELQRLQEEERQRRLTTWTEMRNSMGLTDSSCRTPYQPDDDTNPIVHSPFSEGGFSMVDKRASINFSKHLSSLLRESRSALKVAAWTGHRAQHMEIRAENDAIKKQP
ncbi:hypothetical protein QFC22_006517 [Naganishia vaughanmartiniae]|uniref:Uncharacterized protein n=1 Tax=Naganishia vaughanmartiniae TaxID=1424756 RepID=A0ACC2WIA8_9TREE|nr:hypothetical protein QFC22_006517 [Naganishia vaughanmartiniae]